MHALLTLKEIGKKLAESIYQIKDILPQTEIYFIEKSGHFPDYEKPKELFRILREVL